MYFWRGLTGKSVMCGAVLLSLPSLLVFVATTCSNVIPVHQRSADPYFSVNCCLCINADSNNVYAYNPMLHGLNLVQECTICWIWEYIRSTKSYEVLVKVEVFLRQQCCERWTVASGSTEVTLRSLQPLRLCHTDALCSTNSEAELCANV